METKWSSVEWLNKLRVYPYNGMPCTCWKIRSSFIIESVGKCLYIIYGKLAAFKEDNGVGDFLKYFIHYYLIIYNFYIYKMPYILYAMLTTYLHRKCNIFHIFHYILLSYPFVPVKLWTMCKYVTNILKIHFSENLLHFPSGNSNNQ